MTRVIEIVDRGRGMQLSTSRIAVQDLVPYFQRNCTYDEILEVMPTLTVEEIQAVEQYVRENYESVMQEDRRIREQNAHRVNSPEIEEIRRRGADKMDTLRKEFKKQSQESNDDLVAG
ncbi:MAG TPA: DUF433 domain-containing protein [Pirellulales bacterium]|jgi:uncharacterized protein (DUF433 family)|nr:DUF433 domain-containing protein [Pirellulales bacterium]